MSAEKKVRRKRSRNGTLPLMQLRTVTDRFRALRIRAGYSLDALAKAAGYAGASSIQRYEDDGERGFRRKFIPRDVVDRFAPHFVGRGDPPISEDDVYILCGGPPLGAYPPAPEDEAPFAINGLASDVESPRSPAKLPTVAHLPRNVKVLGTAAGGNGGEFELTGTEIDFVRRPVGISAARDVYAVYVINDSMSPRYEAGDLIYVHPGRPPRVGDYVVIQLRDRGHGARRALIKRLARRTARLLVLEQFNPSRTKEIPMSQVEAIHRILTPNELFGV